MASEAQIRANQQNAQRSTGPVTPGGKEQSRRNALKHGLTGAGVVLPAADAAEVERRAVAFADELEAVGDVETALARLAALNSVRAERGADQQTAALSERVRKVQAEFVAPEGVSEAEAVTLHDEAVRRAMFDPSKEADLARKYGAAAERGFLRALKELRQIQEFYAKPTPDPRAEVFRQELGSFMSMSSMDDEFDEMYAKFVAENPDMADSHPTRASSKAPLPTIPQSRDSFEVPFAIGKRR